MDTKDSLEGLGVPESDTEKAILALGGALRAGSKIRPEWAQYLETLVLEAKKVSTVKVQEGTVGVSVQQIKEKVVEGIEQTLDPVWSQYRQRSSVKEIEHLSHDEKIFIDQMTADLVRYSPIFKATRTKPIGSTSDYKPDWLQFSIKGADFDLSNAISGLENKLSSPLKKSVMSTWNGNTIHLFDYDTDPKFAMVKCRFTTSQRASDHDSRRVPSEYWLMIENSSTVYQGLKQGNAELLRLFPFILKNFAVKTVPEKIAFFDCSLAGEDGLFGEGKNPCMLLDYVGKKITGLTDTQKPPTFAQTKIATTDDQFTENAKSFMSKGYSDESYFNLYKLNLAEVSERDLERIRRSMVSA